MKRKLKSFFHNQTVHQLLVVSEISAAYFDDKFVMVGVGFDLVIMIGTRLV